MKEKHVRNVQETAVSAEWETAALEAEGSLEFISAAANFHLLDPKLWITRKYILTCLLSCHFWNLSGETDGGCRTLSLWPSAERNKRRPVGLSPRGISQPRVFFFFFLGFLFYSIHLPAPEGCNPAFLWPNVEV